jgi:hypothetical protein
MIRTPTSPFVLAPLAVALAAPAARAQNPVCHSFSIPSATTNWTSALQVPRWDPQDGVLLSIDFTLTATTIGTARCESLDARPSTVTTVFQSTLSLRRPDATDLVVAIPTQQFVDPLDAFDGTVDFGGTSGASHLGIVASDVESSTSPRPPSDLALFTGPAGNPGTIGLTVRAQGTSSGSGPGNLILQFFQQAGASVDVCYHWAPDCNQNGVPDAQDISGGTSTDVNFNGVPDECDPPVIDFCIGDGPANGGPSCPCGNEAPSGPIHTGCLNSTGAGGFLQAFGTASVSNDTLLLSAGQMPPNVPGYFFQGTAPVNGGSGTPLGGGIVCMGGAVIRLAKIVSAPQFGTVDLPFGGDPPISVQFQINPGEVRYYQVYYRNFGGPCGAAFNTTNAIRILWGA